MIFDKLKQRWNEKRLKEFNTSLEERKNEELKRKEKYNLDSYEKILSLDRYPGSLKEYCLMKGEEFIIFDLKKPEKYVIIKDLKGYYEWHGNSAIRDGIFYKNLLEQGVEGFIHWTGWESGRRIEYGHGIPVKKKNH